MVDTGDSKSPDFGRESSSLSPGTRKYQNTPKTIVEGVFFNSQKCFIERDLNGAKINFRNHNLTFMNYWVKNYNITFTLIINEFIKSLPSVYRTEYKNHRFK